MSSHGVEAALASVAEHVRGLRRNVVEFDVDALAEHPFACETLSLGLLARLETLETRARRMFSVGGEAIDGAIASIAAHAESEDASAFFAEVESGLAELDEEAAQRFADDFEALRSWRLAGTAFLSLTRRFSRASMPGFREGSKPRAGGAGESDARQRFGGV